MKIMSDEEEKTQMCPTGYGVFGCFYLQSLTDETKSNRKCLLAIKKYFLPQNQSSEYPGAQMYKHTCRYLQCL